MAVPNATTFGLPASLHVPIAATTPGMLERYVGEIEIRQHAGRVNAIKVRARDRGLVREPGVKLWAAPAAREYAARLHPEWQFWVHVDYTGYREAWNAMGMPAIPPGHFLDHVQNRVAMRIKGRPHPYLRLCPVSHAVNTSGGHSSGGEGMETAYLRELLAKDPARLRELSQARAPLVYADPMDLTKMLNIPPGTQVLDGVRETQQLFYE